MTSSTRRSAEISQKIAKFLNYDPDERSTDIGNATLENQVAGYTQPNIQAAIDSLYFITTIPIGGLHASKTSNNPNPVTWERQGQIENIVVSGEADNTFVLTIGGVDTILTEGDTASQVATKVAAAFEASSSYSAVVGSPDNIVIVTFASSTPEDLMTGNGTGSPATIQGISYTVAESTNGSTSPVVSEVQTITFSGTVAISNTFDLIDDSTSPATTLGTVTVVPTDTRNSVMTKIYNALVGYSPDPYASIQYYGQVSPETLSPDTVQVTWGDIDTTVSPEVVSGSLNSRSVQDQQAGGFVIKGTNIQKAVSAADLLSQRTSQIDTITITGTSVAVTNLSLTSLGINVTTGIGDTADVIAAAAAIDIGSIDGLTTSTPSGSPGNSFTVEYINDGISRVTNYKEGFNSSGSTGIVGLTDPDPAGSDIIITYTSVQSQSSGDELGYGKWIFFGETKVPSCPVNSMKAVGVQTINNTILAEPYVMPSGSPDTQTIEIAKELFDVAKIMFSVRSDRGVYVTEITTAHDNTNISWTNNVIVNTDSNESADDDPIDVTFTISGDNIVITLINNYDITLNVAVNINEYNIISSTPQDTIIYLWERIE